MKKVLLLSALSFTFAGITLAQTNNNSFLKGYKQSLSPIKVDTSVNGLICDNKTAEKDLLKKIQKFFAASNQFATNEEYNSNMPVASHSIQYLDSMPIAMPGDKNTRYTMMVKRVDFAKRKPTFAAPLDGQANSDTDKK